MKLSNSEIVKLSSTKVLEIKELHASVEGKEILKGINLSVNAGEIHVLMGPNGSGKSTLCNVLVGNPQYTVTEGSVIFNGKDLLSLLQSNHRRCSLSSNCDQVLLLRTFSVQYRHMSSQHLE